MILNLMILDLFNYLFMIGGSLISVAFLILLERKVLGYIQDRKGPNKVGIIGVVQPFSDAIKLFMKENIKLTKGNYLYYYFSPIISFIISMFLLLSLMFNFSIFYIYYSLMFIMSCLSIFVYLIIVAGWASNSNYSILGGVRAIVQSLSYEVLMFFIFISLFIYSESFGFMEFFYFQFKIGLLFVNMPLFILFFLSILTDLNRIPFDFVEGESELVSGFNTEYMSGSFALFFLSEYLLMIIMGMMISIMFLGGQVNSFMFMFEVYLFCFIVISIRGVLPRMRYDFLMYLCWYTLLPLVMLNLYLVLILKYYLFISV